eukprot:NODE_2863_length_529_cov_50.208333_g2473_i0.p3 GENE.NODE_2863_length_529_cov_50.208333_g2473_i0~~NODE_2863_length_529_cov_50.208333_g2473_i0.p3  ORF type:complete len:90 (-),score=17.87 NODE_2863_length_529_cov_50.208333_g2473_i0:230-499(-)
MGTGGKPKLANNIIREGTAKIGAQPDGPAQQRASSPSGPPSGMRPKAGVRIAGVIPPTGGQGPKMTAPPAGRPAPGGSRPPVIGKGRLG